jgi:hypothetical protein
MSASRLPDGLTPLESEALRMLVKAHPEQADALERQLAIAAVRSRRETGLGFFLNFNVGSAPLVDPANCELNDVYAQVPSLAAPIGFLLFVRRGKIDFLEGHTDGDDWPQSLAGFSMGIQSPYRGPVH